MKNWERASSFIYSFTMKHDCLTVRQFMTFAVTGAQYSPLIFFMFWNFFAYRMHFWGHAELNKAIFINTHLLLQFFLLWAWEEDERKIVLVTTHKALQQTSLKKQVCQPKNQIELHTTFPLRLEKVIIAGKPNQKYLQTRNWYFFLILIMIT